MYVYSTVQKVRPLVFSPTKNSFKSYYYFFISIFSCSVSVGNISLHFQTFIWPLIVIIQWDLCAPHRDLIWSSSVCLESHEETEQTETDSIQKNCVSKTLQFSLLLILYGSENASRYRKYFLIFSRLKILNLSVKADIRRPSRSNLDVCAGVNLVHSVSRSAAGFPI